MLRFMFLEQVLHIMLNQDCSRSLCYFRPQMYELLHYAILGKMENMGGESLQTFAKPSSQPSE